jgi:DNA-directed RNA polymerase subunit M/transcription elongation factor TFIIS
VGKGRNPRGEKEYSKLQQALHENKKLKREIARLRHLVREEVVLDLDEPEDDQPEIKTQSVKRKRDRTCHKCQEGKLVFTEYSKAGGDPWYLRKCNNCDHKTRGKRLTPEVDRD